MAVFLGGISGFETAYKKAPDSVKAIIDELDPEFPGFAELREAKQKLAKKGYFMDYGLDGQITVLRKIKKK